MPQFSNRFPFWVYERNPAVRYEVKESRKLFGKQRYGFAVEGSWSVNKKHDYATREEAEMWLKSLNLYAEVWEIHLAGKHNRIKLMDLLITGDTAKDQKGHSDRSILANVLHSDPVKVHEALILSA